MTPLGARRILWIVAGLAAISVGIAAGPLPWRFLGESGLPPPAPVGAAGGAPPAVSLDPIIALSPFGRPEAEAEPEPEVQETSLGLVLLGVVIATDPADSTAILEGGIGPSRVYAVGDRVADNALLAAVYVDHVVLDVDGHPESLSFPPSVAGAAAPPPPLPAEPEEGEEAGDLADVIEGYRVQLEQDPATVLEDLDLTPTDRGYLVGDSPPDLLTAAGFQSGDVIAQVNGQQVGNIARDARFFSDVVASGHARIELLRNGKRMVLSFPLR